MLRCPEKLTDKQLKDFALQELAPGSGIRFWEMSALDPTGKTLQRILDLHKNAVTGECSLLQSPSHGHHYFQELGTICKVLDLAAACATSKNLEVLQAHKYWGFEKMLELKPKLQANSPLHRAIWRDSADNVRLLVNLDVE